MSDFRVRILNELADLRDRTDKLEKFVVSDAFGELDDVEQTDLKLQLVYMEAYLAILDRRASRLCGDR